MSTAAPARSCWLPWSRAWYNPQKDAAGESLRQNFCLNGLLASDPGLDQGGQTQHDAGALNQNVTDTAAELVGVGGAEHTDHAETGGDQTQQKQHPVTLLGEIL